MTDAPAHLLPEAAMVAPEVCLGVQGAGCRGAGCRVQGAGSRVQGLGCRVWGAGSGVQCLGCRVWSAESGVQGAGCRVQGCRVQGCRVQGLWCRVWSAGCRVKGAGCRVWGVTCVDDRCLSAPAPRSRDGRSRGVSFPFYVVTLMVYKLGSRRCNWFAQDRSGPVLCQYTTQNDLYMLGLMKFTTQNDLYE